MPPLFVPLFMLGQLAKIESPINAGEEDRVSNCEISDLIAFVDTLSTSAPNANQAEVLQSLRNRIQAIFFAGSKQAQGFLSFRQNAKSMVPSRSRWFTIALSFQ
ncbi:MAG: hypothetical protein ACTSO6_08220 [Promethearchaeota archaeon]